MTRCAAALALALIVLAGLIALGVWQVRRLAAKEALIARVGARLKASPVPAPGPQLWWTIGKDDAYRRVSAHGTFLAGRDTLVQAATERGGGFWVLTPLVTDRGFTILINRGFVPPEHRTVTTPAGPVSVTGLLRVSEPGGGFLRSNDPAAGRWYSRDVTAIATARRLTRTPPYFIDADAMPNPGGFPVGGLTVVRFANSHLVYALTWFAMAALLGGTLVRLAWRTRSGYATP